LALSGVLGMTKVIND